MGQTGDPQRRPSCFCGEAEVTKRFNPRRARVNDRLLRAVQALRSHGGPMTLRECYTKKVAGCKDAGSARKLFKELAEAGYGKIAETKNPSGGRKTEEFRLRIYDAAISNQTL